MFHIHCMEETKVRKSLRKLVHTIYSLRDFSAVKNEKLFEKKKKYDIFDIFAQIIEVARRF